MRISRDSFIIETLRTTAKRGTCSRAQVGAIAMRDGRIIATGYNGAPRGVDHCTHTSGEDSPCEIAVHAEANLISFASRHGVSLGDSSLFCTHMPCIKCAQLIINAGFKDVGFIESYRRLEGVKLLNQVDIPVTSIVTGERHYG